MILLALVLVLVPVFIYVSIYNSLIAKKNNVSAASSNIDVQLKKRYDLIPNLVSTVKEFMVHEKELFTDITKLRSELLTTKNIDDKVKIDHQLNNQLKQLMLVVENYPNIKSDSHFLNLQKNLTEIESQISASRRTYNAVVNSYNISIQSIPGVWIAGVMNLKPKNNLEFIQEELNNVSVKDIFNS